MSLLPDSRGSWNVNLVTMVAALVTCLLLAVVIALAVWFAIDRGDRAARDAAEKSVATVAAANAKTQLELETFQWEVVARLDRGEECWHQQGAKIDAALGKLGVANPYPEAHQRHGGVPLNPRARPLYRVTDGGM